MHCAGATGGKANANFARQLGVAAGHESGLFLMPHLDEVYFVLAA
jgi:hypothetical protein